MFNILERIGLGWIFRPKKDVKTVRLDIIAEQVREFNEAKKELNNRISSLESRTMEIDNTLDETLGITKENQRRLVSMEENMNRIIQVSEALLGKGMQVEVADDTGKADENKVGDAKPAEQAEAE
jgi:exonuclease VII small subunit